MDERMQLMHNICRCAILWEREDNADNEKALKSAVREYMSFLIESSLPVAPPKVEKPQPSDPGVVIRR